MLLQRLNKKQIFLLYIGYRMVSTDEENNLKDKF